MSERSITIIVSSNLPLEEANKKLSELIGQVRIPFTPGTSGNHYSPLVSGNMARKSAIIIEESYESKD